jgi:hypothetical protein
MTECRHCKTPFDSTETRACPSCGKKLPGPSKGTKMQGRPPSKKPADVRNARVVWVRLNRKGATRLARMLNNTELDGAKLGRAAIAAIDRLRKRRRVDSFLKEVLGDDYDAIVRG